MNDGQITHLLRLREDQLRQIVPGNLSDADYRDIRESVADETGAPLERVRDLQATMNISLGA